MLQGRTSPGSPGGGKRVFRPGKKKTEQLEKKASIVDSIDRAVEATPKTTAMGRERKTTTEGVKTKKRSKSKDRKKERYREKTKASEGTDEMGTDSGKEVATEGVKKKRSKSKDRKKERYREKMNAAKENEEPSTDTGKEVAAEGELSESMRENTQENMSNFITETSGPRTTEEFTYAEDGEKINVLNAVKQWEAHRAAGSDTCQRRLSA